LRFGLRAILESQQRLTVVGEASDRSSALAEMRNSDWTAAEGSRTGALKMQGVLAYLIHWTALELSVLNDRVPSENLVEIS
jgi:hypothetical protein